MQEGRLFSGGVGDRRCCNARAHRRPRCLAARTLSGRSAILVVGTDARTSAISRSRRLSPGSSGQRRRSSATANGRSVSACRCCTAVPRCCSSLSAAQAFRNRRPIAFWSALAYLTFPAFPIRPALPRPMRRCSFSGRWRFSRSSVAFRRRHGPGRSSAVWRSASAFSPNTRCCSSS